MTWGVVVVEVKGSQAAPATTYLHPCQDHFFLWGCICKLFHTCIDWPAWILNSAPRTDLMVTWCWHSTLSKNEPRLDFHTANRATLQLQGQQTECFLQGNIKLRGVKVSLLSRLYSGLVEQRDRALGLAYYCSGPLSEFVIQPLVHTSQRSRVLLAGKSNLEEARCSPNSKSWERTSSCARTRI